MRSAGQQHLYRTAIVSTFDTCSAKCCMVCKHPSKIRRHCFDFPHLRAVTLGRAAVHIYTVIQRFPSNNLLTLNYCKISRNPFRCKMLLVRRSSHDLSSPLKENFLAPSRSVDCPQNSLRFPITSSIFLHGKFTLHLAQVCEHVYCITYVNIISILCQLACANKPASLRLS